MALIKCPECGKEYSNLAQVCPNCGCPTNVVVDTPKPQPVAPAPKKKVNPFVDVEETEDAIIKKYKSLPSVPKVLTIIGLVITPLSIMGILSAIGGFAMINSLAGETIFNEEYYSEGQLISILLFSTWSIISMIGIIRLKQWGMISYVCCKGLDILITLLCMHQWGITWVGIIYSLMFIVIYLCTFMFEESGHNAFAIVLNNGVIKEKNTDNFSKQI